MHKNFNKQKVYTWLMKVLIAHFFLFFSIFSFANTVSSAGQSILQKRVSMSVENMRIKDVLKKIEETDSVQFAYLANPFNFEKQVSLSIEDSPLVEVLGMLFDGHATFEDRGDVVVIKPANDDDNISLTQVSGRVTDEKGEPMPGVNVAVKGTAQGTITDVDGKFSLPVEDTNVVLEFSFVGYVSQEVSVGSRSVIDIQLLSDQKQLDEIVVVGYGTQKKANLTGAISYVDGSALEKRVSPNTISLLQGQLPGLQVVQGSGRPGAEGIQLQIRGMGSYGSSNEPLILVDGVPGPMPTVENVASVTVLKDAASAAIYGSRAANGVILVTTKRGKSGRASFDFGNTTSIYQASKIPDLITNSADFMSVWNSAADHSNSPGEKYAQSDIDKYKNANEDPQYPNTDWMKYLFRKVTVMTNSLTVTGGNSNTTYNLNFNYLTQPGVVQGSGFNRLASRLNVESKLNKWIKAGVNVGMEYNTTNSVVGDLFLAAFTQSPTYGPFLRDGSGKLVKNAFPAIEYKNNRNPFALLDGSNSKSFSLNSILNPYIHLDFTDWLTLDVNASFNTGYGKTKSFASSQKTHNWFTGSFAETTSPGGDPGVSVRDNSSINPLLYSTLQFNKDFKKHNVGAMTGTQIEYSKSENLSAYRRDYYSDLTQEIDAGGLTGIQNGGNASELSQLSFLGRLNYNYDDRYFAEFNIRADASSRFAPGHRWGYFPSASAGWRIFREKFIPKIEWWNEAKVRASYGKLGNQGGNNYPYQLVMSPSGLYSFDNSTILSGVAPSGLVNRDISWEVTKVLDFGVDLGFFDNRLLITFDWFEKNTSGILRKQQVTYETGFPGASPYVNSGGMKNTGFEFSIDYKSKQVKDKFSYGLSWNFQTYKNKVVTFGADEIEPSPYGPTIKREGIPYNSYYIYQWDGIFQTQQEADASGQSNKPKAGDLKIKDISGPTGVPDGKVDGFDKQVVDGVFPKFSTGFTFTASYKNFDLYAFFYASVGQKVYVYGPGFEPFYQGSVPTKDWLNAWTPENHSNTLPAVYNAQRYNSTWTTYPNTWFLKDNSFGRLKSLNIGWTCPINQGIKSARVFVAGENLFTLTRYVGLDPERTGGGNYLTYPQNRIYSAGVTLKF